MDTITENSCLEDISSLVFDSLEKVTLKTISNNWNIPNEVAKTVLNKWFSLNEKKIAELVKEFIVQGINSKGTFSISVVPEEIKKKLENRWKNFDAWPYSVEIKSNSRTLNLPPVFEPIVVKNIKISPGIRNLHVSVKCEPSTSKVDTTKIKTPFGMVKPVEKKKEIKKEFEIKKEPDVENQQKQTTSKQEELKTLDTSKEDEKSLKNSLENKSSTLKASANGKKGASKPIAQGKASISSFFSKSSAPKTHKEATIASVEVKKEQPDSPDDIEVKKEESRKRSSPSPEKTKKEPAKKPTSKKLKLKNPSNKKRSRIQVIDDSSEDEQEDEQSLEEPESKFIKFDREFTPEETANRSLVKEEQSSEKKPETTKSAKNKAKRWVTKRFETDDGFIRTERVLEEYSASEDENDENRKKNSPLQEKKAEKQSPATTEKVSPQKKLGKKPKDTGKGKQGSIMNFFSKK